MGKLWSGSVWRSYLSSEVHRAMGKEIMKVNYLPVCVIKVLLILHHLRSSLSF